jgi:hypothetical protein
MDLDGELIEGVVNQAAPTGNWSPAQERCIGAGLLHYFSRAWSECANL